MQHNLLTEMSFRLLLLTLAISVMVPSMIVSEDRPIADKLVQQATAERTQNTNPSNHLNLLVKKDLMDPMEKKFCDKIVDSETDRQGYTDCLSALMNDEPMNYRAASARDLSYCKERMGGESILEMFCLDWAAYRASVHYGTITFIALVLWICIAVGCVALAKYFGRSTLAWAGWGILFAPVTFVFLLAMRRKNVKRSI